MSADAVAPGGPGRSPLVPELIVPDLIVPDLIVLAGGSGTRLGGTAKPAVEIAGRTLLSRALDARTLATRTVVVGPESCRAAAGAAAAQVLWALEDPPLGGPVAGVAAGLAVLERDAAHPPDSSTRASGWVLLLACDLPWAADAARILLAAARPATDPPHAADAADPLDALDVLDALDALDGIHLVDAAGRAQWLAGLYRTSALSAAVRLAGAGARGGRMRDLLSGLRLRGILDDSNAGRDVDTWQDVAATEAILNPPARGPRIDATNPAEAAAD